jgi:CRP-like cAMP-binding protein
MAGTPVQNATQCSGCPVRRLALFQPLGAAEVSAMQAHRLEQRELAAGALLYGQDTHLEEVYTLFSGWVMLSRTLADGRRQILRFVLPGDVLGFQPSFEGPILHAAQALTPVTVCVFRREALLDMFREYPILAVQMAWISARDEALANDHLLSVGRRPAKERIAQLFLELHHRLAARGPVSEHAGIPVPLKQEHIADAVGLTTIHVNRTLRSLREGGMAVLRGGLLKILDRQALVELTGFKVEPFSPRPLL